MSEEADFLKKGQVFDGKFFFSFDPDSLKNGV